MNGFFDLSSPIFESNDPDDLMNLQVQTEETEFGTKNPATNPTVNSNHTEQSIPVPGGIKEQPAAKPSDERSIPIPGGLSETPTAKPKDAASIPVPGSTTLTSNVYNDALTNLQKSFKESIEVIEMMKQVKVYDESVDELIIESFDSDEKSEIKALTKKFKSLLKAAEDDMKFTFTSYTGWEVVKAHLKKAFILPAMFEIWSAGYSTLFRKIFTESSFQIVGFITMRDDSMKNILSSLNKKYAEDLEDYKLFADGTIARLCCGSDTNQDKSFLIYIDKKSKNILSENLKSATSKMKEDPKVKEASKNKDSAKTESVENKDKCNKEDEKCKDCDEKDKKEKDEKEKNMKESYELNLNDIEV